MSSFLFKVKHEQISNSTVNSVSENKEGDDNVCSKVFRRNKITLQNFCTIIRILLFSIHTKVRRIEFFCLDTMTSIVKTIKSQVLQKEQCGAKVCECLKFACGTEALFKAVYPLCANFFRKKNQDHLGESTFKLIRQSCDLFNCKNYKAAKLKMIHTFYHLF